MRTPNITPTKTAVKYGKYSLEVKIAMFEG